MLCDLPDVIERAKPAIAAAGLADRLQAIPTDFFAAVPAGADAYMMRHIIHDWTDEQSRPILRNIRKRDPAPRPAAGHRNRHSARQRPQLCQAARFEHAADPRRQERTEAEYRRLYQASGFELSKITPTKADVSVIEGRPV